MIMGWMVVVMMIMIEVEIDLLSRRLDRKCGNLGVKFRQMSLELAQNLRLPRVRLEKFAMFLAQGFQGHFEALEMSLFAFPESPLRCTILCTPSLYLQ